MIDDNVVSAIEVKGLRKVYKRLVAVDDVSHPAAINYK